MDNGLGLYLIAMSKREGDEAPLFFVLVVGKRREGEGAGRNGIIRLFVVSQVGISMVTVEPLPGCESTARVAPTN